jgi:hypothetical protein
LSIRITSIDAYKPLPAILISTMANAICSAVTVGGAHQISCAEAADGERGLSIASLSSVS